MIRPFNTLATAVVIALTTGIANGQADFGRAIFYKSAEQPYLFKSGDFNGDSKPDVAYWEGQTQKILHVAFNNGDGTFSNYSLPAQVADVMTSMEVADINSDGRDDILGLSFNSGSSVNFTFSIVAYTSAADNTFDETHLTDVPIPAYQDYGFLATDFDNDGQLDILIGTEGKTKIFKGNGSGGFASAVEVEPTGLVGTIKQIDINGDDKEDFVAKSSQNKPIAVFIKNATGYTKSTFGTGGYIDYSVYDFTGDGFPDIVTAAFGTAVTMFTNDGHGAFPTTTTYLAGQDALTINHADYDYDGKEDLAVVDLNSVHVLHNTGTSFEETGPTSIRADAMGALFLDLDNTGFQELIEFYWVGFNTYEYETSKFVFKYNDIIGFEAFAASIVDINNDGHPDILTGDDGTGAVAINYGNGGLRPDPPVYIKSLNNIAIISVVSGDFNSDDFPDIIYSGYNGPTFETSIILSNDGELNDPVLIADNYFVRIAVGDFNDDGKLDFMGPSTIMLGDGAGNFQYQFNGTPSFYSVRQADFNHDGLPDIAAFTDRKVYIGINSGSTPIFPAFNEVSSLDADDFSVGFFNDDELPDLLSSEGFGKKKFSVHINNGNGSSFTKKTFSIGAADGILYAEPFPGDLDNDGVSEVIAPWSTNPEAVGEAVFKMQPNGDFSEVLRIDAVDPAFSVPRAGMVADLNSDTKADIITFNTGVHAITIIPGFSGPKMAAHDLAVTNITANEVTLSVENGDGTGRIFFLRKQSDPAVLPVDNTSYRANPKFGLGKGPSDKIYALIKGDYGSVRVTGLAPSTAYVATIFEYSETFDGAKIDYLTTTPAEASFTTGVSKQVQTIAFTSPGDRLAGSSGVALVATATSGLGATFTALTENISIAADILTFNSPGPAKIDVSVEGNPLYNAASITVEFCVNPAIPTITEQTSSDIPTLVSSSVTNNHWLENGAEIAGATDKEFGPDHNGSYSVKVDYDGCSSTSLSKNVVVTGLEDAARQVSIYPNPAKNSVTIDLSQLALTSNSVLFTDILGRRYVMSGSGNKQLTIDVSHLSKGQYVIELHVESGPIRKKLVIE